MEIISFLIILYAIHLSFVIYSIVLVIVRYVAISFYYLYCSYSASHNLFLLLCLNWFDLAVLNSTSVHVCVPLTGPAAWPACSS